MKETTGSPAAKINGESLILSVGLTDLTIYNQFVLSREICLAHLTYISSEPGNQTNSLVDDTYRWSPSRSCSPHSRNGARTHRGRRCHCSTGFACRRPSADPRRSATWATAAPRPCTWRTSARPSGENKEVELLNRVRPSVECLYLHYLCDSGTRKKTLENDLAPYIIALDERKQADQKVHANHV